MNGNPASPSASEASTASGPSSSLSFQIAQTSRSTVLAENVAAQDAGKKVITASVQLLRGGCLPGDLIPVKISVRHIKQVKSMHGVIVTLYRKARIDPRPIFPPGSPYIRNSRYDDLLPGSRTGLGGLSLSRSSNHQFRMDLAQTFAPMIVNPLTLEAEIRTAVRAPADGLFPTITGIPGDMIAFTYHVEVIMDLACKLANQDRFFPRINMTSQSPAFSLGSRPSLADYGAQSSSETYPLVDTTKIRREKYIPHYTFDIVVGSRDSNRVDGRTPQEGEYTWMQEGADVGEAQAPDDSALDGAVDMDESVETVEDADLDRTETIRPPPIAPPEIEEPADEKARIRLAEQRLLPSAPLADDAEPLSAQPQPSAPTLDEIEGTASHQACLDSLFSTVSLEHGTHTVNGESAPAYRHSEPSSSLPANHTSAPSRSGDDKQELERQRLLALASSPDDDPDDEVQVQRDGEGAPSSSTSAPRLPPPSAPALDEGDNDYILEESEHSSSTHETPVQPTTPRPFSPAATTPVSEKSPTDNARAEISFAADSPFSEGTATLARDSGGGCVDEETQGTAAAAVPSKA